MLSNTSCCARSRSGRPNWIWMSILICQRLMWARRQRPAGPCSDCHAPLSPGGAVDQDEALAAGLKDAQAEARTILVEYHIFPAANFGGFHNSFRQMRPHAGPPFRADSGMRCGKEQPALCEGPAKRRKPAETNRELCRTGGVRRGSTPSRPTESGGGSCFRPVPRPRRN
jgi:hypothetical protein